MCVTSPPYWGLRDYQTAPLIWGGSPGCAHYFGESGSRHRGGPPGASEINAGRDRSAQAETGDIDTGAFCLACGAWRGSLGLEPTPQFYVEHLVEIFREVRRVLHPMGTLWLNLGDCYATGAGKVGEHPGGGEQGERWAGRDGRGTPARCVAGAGAGERVNLGPRTQPNRMPIPGLKAKDLVGIPWRVAFALQAGWARCDGCGIERRGDLWPEWNGHRICLDCERAGRLGSHVIESEQGWWLRNDIIWAKRNGMPESAADRCTKSHEYLFLLAKSEHYYFDGLAIEEPQEEAERARRLRESEEGPSSRYEIKLIEGAHGQHAPGANGVARSAEARQRLAQKGTRNRRSVWSLPTAIFPEAHFATFPPALVEPCIAAGTSAAGHCTGCGEGWERPAWDAPYQVAWGVHCNCGHGETRRPVVLDICAGAGTTGLVADRMGRDAVLIELSEKYVGMIERRIRGDAPLFAEIEVQG